ncbi:DUF3455 domain-containing protein [Paraburkholderia sp. NMBU_R16]|uniref:DUF3455 domain-containing protein n=1 Tax=Paraburkholderia sp. NMBU_R16 TaxID=2698676 RepID=UPI0015652BA2|nr:DUF3455 domain-containing protein [Paraburkholderia sp. NMBU_R16]NRO95242.1 DUF3455 domain-containing protein [Paraburkholderia sp. NMBU_R16]
MIRPFPSTCTQPIRRLLHAAGGIASPLLLAASVAAALGTLAGCATREVPPANTTLPESLRTPPQEVLEDALTAVGETIYSCRRQAGRLAWVDKGSEGTLVDAARRNVGTLVPGPRFVAYDGSYVSGRIAAQEIVATDALAWQLIVARRTSGAEKGKGRFAKVTSIQQVRTRGGLPPQPDCNQQGLSMLVPFSATYLVYRSASAPPAANPAPAAGTVAPVPTTAPAATPLSSTAAGLDIAATAAAPISAFAPAPLPAPTDAPHDVSATHAATLPPSTPPALTVASVSEASGLGLPMFFAYLRP